MSSDEHKNLDFRERTQRLFLRLTSLPPWTGYVTSILATAASTLLLVKVQEFIKIYDHLPKGPAIIALYFLAIALSTVIGGLGAGLFAVLLSFCATIYFLMPPTGLSFDLTMQNYVTLFIDLSVGTLVTLGMDAYRNNTLVLMENLNLLSIEKARANQEAVLNKIGQAVRTARNPEHVQSVAVAAVGQILDADRCYFVNYIPARNSAAIGQYWRRDNQSESNLTFRLTDTGIDLEALYDRGQTMVIDDAHAEGVNAGTTILLDKRGVRSAIIVPIAAEGQSDSTIVVAMSDRERVWKPREIALVEAVAAQTRAAVDYARIQQKEHNIAIQLQAALQPELSLNASGLSIASFYRAALEEANVGGDFYDAYTLSSGYIVFVVGDVSGKGLAAASQVAAIRHMLRCLLQTMPSIVDAVEQLNDVLMEQSLLPAFATLFIAVLDPSSLILEYLSCGHEPGLIYRKGKVDQVIQLPANGPVIGVFENARAASHDRYFESSRMKLRPGDSLLLYTDGVCDAGEDITCRLGVDGVIQHLTAYHSQPERTTAENEQSSSLLLQYCVEATETFANGVLRDDICLLAVTISDHYDFNRQAATAQSVNQSLDEVWNIKVDQTDIAEQRKVLLADVLRLVTGGKLHIVLDQKDLPKPLLHRAEPVTLDVGENVRLLRRIVRDTGKASGLANEFSDSLEMAAGEAANNSLVHAEKGVGLVSWDLDGNVQVRIEDSGHGIPFEDLPRATVERGYTTAGTLGQGFWIILQSVQRCWIATSSSGTTVVLEYGNQDVLSDPFPISTQI